MLARAAENGKPRRGRPPRTEAQRRAHRGRLVDAAIDAIRERGPDVSIDDIATAAGVSKPVLYDEFGSRLGIADAIAVVVAERVERQVIDQLASGGAFDLEIAVRVFVRSLIDLIETEQAVYAFLVRSIRTPERGFLDNALLASIHERAALVVGLIAPGLPKAHLRVLTDGLFGFLFAAIESWQSAKKPRKNELIDTLTHVIRVGFSGVAAEVTAAR
jgi:AcrR family transcriptional regulator